MATTRTIDTQKRMTRTMSGHMTTFGSRRGRFIWLDSGRVWADVYGHVSCQWLHDRTYASVDTKPERFTVK